MSLSPARALSPEAILVYRSASLAVESSETAALAGPSLDWSRVLMLAEGEVATASLGRQLHAARDVAVPEFAAEYLRKSGMVSDFRMRFLAERLAETVRRLREGGVPVMLLKGAAVGALIDPTFISRPMTDIDLLVRREDIAGARTAILAAGWEETTDLVLVELLRNHHHLPPFVDHRMPGIRLELHLSMFAPDHSFEFDEESLWSESRASAAPFVGASVPSSEHLLLHGCVHFAWQHTMQFGAWRTFRLVSAIVVADRLDWDQFVVLARATKGATACYWTLRLARRMAGIAVPAEVLAKLSAPTPEWICSALERHFVAAIVPGEGPPSPSERLSRMLWNAALRPQWSGHRTPGRWDPERRWERARGSFTTETVPSRFARHLSQYRAWARFVSQTLLR